MVEYTISDYIDDNGKEPIKYWLKSLDGTTRKRILTQFWNTSISEPLSDTFFGNYSKISLGLGGLLTW